MSSLINESPLQFSAQLAATIGLEEAIVLQLLHDTALMQGSNPYQIAVSALVQRLSFWSLADIQRILKSLCDKGVLQQLSPPVSQSESLQYRFDTLLRKEAAPAVPTPIAPRGANKISPYFQPDETVLQQLAQHGVSADFARQQVNEFVTYWRERDEISHSWQARFLKHTLRAWQIQRSQPWLAQANETPQPLQAMWQPSQDALEILQRNGINSRFIEDAVPEFVLYWRERGTATNTWNSKFIQHVKQQWARYTSSLQHDTEPRRIPVNWQPSNDVYDILRMANIDANFAKARIDEFVLYWKDSNKMQNSWNTKFLQHVKYCWANQHQITGGYNAQRQNATGQGTAAGSFIEKHTDRSWAE